LIAADSSTLIAYLAGERGKDVEALDEALAQRAVCLPPVVLTEILSDPNGSDSLGRDLRDFPLLDATTGYWERAGQLRRKVLSTGRRARLADVLIAQSCLDHDTSLITRDRDFAGFASVSALKLIPSP
jgi:predicted nucleic acid-binding protein